MGKITGNPKGRPKGAKNKRTAAREKAVSAVSSALSNVIDGAFHGDAHALLMAVYKDPKNQMDLRVDAAKAAIRYEKPALSSTSLKNADDNPLRVEVTSARNSLAEKLARIARG